MHEQVSRMQLGLPASDLLLDSAVVGMGGAVRLVLLVGFKDASGGRLKIVPLLAESSEGLPREQLPLDEVGLQFLSLLSCRVGMQLESAGI